MKFSTTLAVTFVLSGALISGCTPTIEDQGGGDALTDNIKAVVADNAELTNRRSFRLAGVGSTNIQASEFEVHSEPDDLWFDIPFASAASAPSVSDQQQAAQFIPEKERRSRKQAGGGSASASKPLPEKHWRYDVLRAPASGKYTTTISCSVSAQLHPSDDLQIEARRLTAPTFDGPWKVDKNWTGIPVKITPGASNATFTGSADHTQPSQAKHLYIKHELRIAGRLGTDNAIAKNVTLDKFTMDVEFNP